MIKLIINIEARVQKIKQKRNHIFNPTYFTDMWNLSFVPELTFPKYNFYVKFTQLFTFQEYKAVLS